MFALISSVPLAPLLGALLAGFLGARIGREGAHWATIIAVGWSFIASCLIAIWVIGDGEVINFDWYVWARMGDVTLSIGFLVDNLTILMMLVVSFVSLMVHIYTVGYMAHDPGYCRFFSYISLFTFSMLMQVMLIECYSPPLAHRQIQLCNPKCRILQKQAQCPTKSLSHRHD